MTLREVEKQLRQLTELMDGSTEGVIRAAQRSQQLIYQVMMEQLNAMDVEGGRLVATQNYAGKLAAITRAMDDILGREFAPAISSYLRTYDTIDETNLKMHRDYNQIKLEIEEFNPVRKSIYKQAKDLLTDGLATNYKNPAKYMIAQAATTGMTIKQARRMVEDWNEGKMATGGQLATNQPTPRLSTYAGQIARDAIFSYNGSEQELIRQNYGMKQFIYVGQIIKTSRTFCRLLVEERGRKIGFDEFPEFEKKAAKIDGETIPKGMIPGTTKQNFCTRRGGYNCNHNVLVVR